MDIKQRLHKRKLRCADLFSRSGIVARYFKQHASALYVNDLEAYAEVNNAYDLTNRSEVDFPLLQEELCHLENQIRTECLPGFITELYAPRNDLKIHPGECSFRPSAWSEAEMFQHCLEIAERSILYYLSKYGKPHFLYPNQP